MEEAPLQPPGAEPVPELLPAPAGLAPFRAGKAFLSLLAYFGGQFLFGVVAVIITAICTGASGRGARDGRFLQGALVGAGIGSALAVLWATRRWARHLARDPSPSGLGLVRPPIRSLLLSILAGAALAVAYLAGVLALGGDGSKEDPGPVSKLAVQSGTGRLIWAVFALAIAPPAEELLFRGLMLKGFAASWGIRAASILTTLIFVVLHLQETRSSVLALIAIGALAASALTARLLTGSLYCSMVLHFAYNLVIVTAVYAALGY